MATYYPQNEREERMTQDTDPQEIAPPADGGRTVTQTPRGVHFNALTPDEDERLALLAEECAEVIQAVAKIQRHGYESHNPTSASLSPSNREALEEELGHVQHAIDRMIEAHDVTALGIIGARKAKAARIMRWLHHQIDAEAPHVR